MEVGHLLVETFVGERLFPTTGARVVVRCDLGIQHHEVFTDENGRSEKIPLSAAHRDTTHRTPHGNLPEIYPKRYTVEVSHKRGFQTTIVHGVEIFPGIVSILPVRSRSATPGSDEIYEIFIPCRREADLHDRSSHEETVIGHSNENILSSSLVVPPHITVHMGQPDEEAETLVVSLKEYVKNVASGENNPSWEDAALGANILMQMSVALDRISDNRSRNSGRNFDITNRPGHGSAFVPGRNTFNNVSRIVDELWGLRVIEKDGRMMPPNDAFRHSARNLALRGYNPAQIINYICPHHTVSGFHGPYSPYPGFILREGTVSDRVSDMQGRLNRISRNWRIPPTGALDGVYGPRTEASVYAFQKAFGLPQNGAIDKCTWSEIIDISENMEKFGEPSLPGERFASGEGSEGFAGAPGAVGAASRVDEKETFEESDTERAETAEQGETPFSEEISTDTSQTNYSTAEAVSHSVNPAMLLALGLSSRRRWY